MKPSHYVTNVVVVNLNKVVTLTISCSKLDD